MYNLSQKKNITSDSETFLSKLEFAETIKENQNF